MNSSSLLHINPRSSHMGCDLDPSRVCREAELKDIVITMAGAFKRFIPMFDRVLVERLAAETKTKGGVLIPEKAQVKVQTATVVAVGQGSKSETGNIIPNSVKAGDQVLLPEYGGTKIVLEEKDYFLFRDGDILGKFESSS